MALTETAPAPPAESTASEDVVVAELPGIAGWLTTSDHKRVGRLWIAASLLFLLGGGVLGSLLGIERSQNGLNVLGRSGFGQVYTLHGEIAVLLFLVPLVIGIATVVVPLQVGAPEIAFPRGAATAFWLYLVSGGVLVAAYLDNGGPQGGTNREAIDLWLLAMLGILLATVVALVSILTTILVMRAGGMTLLRAPAFAWSVLVGGSLTLLTVPVLGARLAEMYVSHHFGGDLGSYRSEIGWFWSLPQVYVLAVPAAGVALEVVPVLARSRVRLHAAGLVVIGVLGVAGVGAWAQVPRTFNQVLYIAIALLAVLPALALLGLLGDTARGGRPQLKAAFALAMGAVLLLLAGAVSGALLSIDPLKLHGTVWEAAQVHLVLMGGAALGGFAALWWWAPKLWGTRLSEGAGFLVFLTTFGGTLLLAVPDLVNGLANDTKLRTTGGFSSGERALNAVSAAGGIVVSLGAVIVVVALLAAARRRRSVDANPWGGYTLEWSTASPPPRQNFAGPLPTVTSATPLLTPEVSA